MGILGISGEISAWSPVQKRNTQANGTDFSNKLYEKMTAYYNGKPLSSYSSGDTRYTDKATGISWYAGNGKFPYMTGKDAEKFYKLCEETGEFPVKKFAEMTGMVRQLDNNTTAFIGDNGTAIKGKDGKELFVSTSGMGYDEVMRMFDGMPKTGNFFDSSFWRRQMLL